MEITKTSTIVTDEEVKRLLGENIFGAIRRAKEKCQICHDANQEWNLSPDIIDQAVSFLCDIAKTIGTPGNPLKNDSIKESQMMGHQVIWNKAITFVSPEMPAWQFCQK